MKRSLVIFSGAVLLVSLYFLITHYTATPKKMLPATTALPVLLRVESEALPVLTPHTHGPADAVDDAGHGVLLRASEITTNEDMWVSGERVKITNAPRAILHHVNILVKRPNSDTANSYSVGEKFLNEIHGISIGQDVSDTVLLPVPYASFFPKGTRLVTTVMLHDAEPPEGPGGTYKNVSVSIDFLGLGFDKNHARKTAAVYLTLADNDSTTHDTFTVPPETQHYVRDTKNPNESGRATFIFPTSGTIVGLGAHIHAWQGGERIDVRLNGNTMESFIPYKASSDAWDWHTDYVQSSIKVHSGDMLTISARYSNNSGIPERGAMGAVVANFAPDIK